jgi:nucleotide-binding universal stress UspA family protein
MIEMRRILCAFDFSEFAERALRHAASVARWYGADLHLLHVAAPASPHTAGDRRFGHQALDAVLAPLLPARVNRFIRITDGSPAPAILAYARQNEVDLLVMGTHGRGGGGRLLIGSVAEPVLRNAPCPVMTIHRAERRSSERPPFRRILCAVDFSPASQRALAYGLELAAHSDAEITFLHVLERHCHGGSEAPSSEEPETAVERETHERLRRVLPADARQWCRPYSRVILGNVAEAVVGEANRIDADLVVIGTHGRNAVDELLFGSNADEVVRRARSPVLTIGPTSAGSIDADMNPGELVTSGVDR